MKEKENGLEVLAAVRLHSPPAFFVFAPVLGDGLQAELTVLSGWTLSR